MVSCDGRKPWSPSTTTGLSHLPPGALQQIKLPALLAALAASVLVVACAQDSGATAPQDDTADVQARVDAGGMVTFDARLYRLSRTIVISRSGTTIQGAGPGTR